MAESIALTLTREQLTTVCAALRWQCDRAYSRRQHFLEARSSVKSAAENAQCVSMASNWQAIERNANELWRELYAVLERESAKAEG